MNEIEFKRIIENIRSKIIKYRPDFYEYHQEDLIQSAVLVPLAFHHSDMKLIFTRRSSHLERHSGQVSFPGGVIEAQDSNPVQTAIRETEEEIGIKRSQIEILGGMKPFNSSTGYFIYPYIGIMNNLNGLQKNGLEVDRVFCVPYRWLANSQNSRLDNYIDKNGNKRKIWFYKEFEGEIIWGITAKITKDLIDLIKN